MLPTQEQSPCLLTPMRAFLIQASCTQSSVCCTTLTHQTDSPRSKVKKPPQEIQCPQSVDLTEKNLEEIRTESKVQNQDQTLNKPDALCQRHMTGTSCDQVMLFGGGWPRPKGGWGSFTTTTTRARLHKAVPPNNRGLKNINK